MATFDSVNPARPSEVIGTYRVQGAADVDRAVEAAAAAQRRWARVPIPARAGLITSEMPGLSDAQPGWAGLRRACAPSAATRPPERRSRQSSRPPSRPERSRQA